MKYFEQIIHASIDNPKDICVFVFLLQPAMQFVPEFELTVSKISVM
jgi:hypothetical protein